MNRFRSTRIGSTLIETALSLPIFTALLVLAISGVHQVMHVSRLAKDRGQMAYGLARLEHSLRSDVHQAVSARVVQDEKSGLLTLQLALPDENRVVYRVRPTRIEREEMDASEKKGLDSFALFSENKVLMEVADNRTVMVSIHRVHRDQTGADRLELFVRSTVGRPHLLESAERGAKDE